MQATLDPGDEVILPVPYWVTYPEAIKLAGALPKIIQTDKKNNYKVTPAQLKKVITEKTVLFVLNSPSNREVLHIHLKNSRPSQKSLRKQR